MTKHSPYENQIQIDIKRNSKQMCNFSHSFRPIYIVSRIFGHMPFSIIYHSNGEIERPVVNKLDVMWSIIAFTLYIYAVFIASNWVHTQQEYNILPNISISVDAFVFGSLLILGLVAIVFDMYHRLKFVHIVKNFIIFDKKVRLDQFKNDFVKKNTNFNCRFRAWAFILIIIETVEFLGYALQQQVL